MVNHRIAEAFVHQTIHGYSEGHQLLVASREFQHAEADVLGHNSDSAPRSRASNGPYITGYPLGDVAYVVARTWADTDAQRPNTVITRSLILPRSSLPHIGADLILDRLVRPGPGSIEARLEPFAIEELAGPPIDLSAEEARVAASYYVDRRPLFADDQRGRDRVALAIWHQLWLSASSGLYFCTAPDTTRFARNERPLLFSGEDLSVGRAAFIETDELQVIRADLTSPGSFRSFAHFVGSGERAVGLMLAFAEAYQILDSPTVAATDFSDLLARYRGAEPPRLRRLKRRVLGFQGNSPRWNVKPFELLDGLAHGDLGRAVYASDASLDHWLREWWDLDPYRTANALTSQLDAPATPVGPATASEGLARAFAAEASNLITPQTLDVVMAISADEALRAIWDRNEPGLWRAWLRLGDQVEIPRSPDYDGKHYDWPEALKAIRSDVHALGRILQQYPEALDYLIALADSEPMTSDLEVQLTREARYYLRDRLKESHNLICGLARLSDHLELPRTLDSAGWLRTLQRSNDEVVHAIAYLISVNEFSKNWRVTASAVVILYERFENPGADQAWNRLSPHLKGDRHTWDRCGRLVEDFAGHFRTLGGDDQRQVVEFIAAADDKVARALAEHSLAHSPDKRKSKKFNVLDPWTWW